jgi:hypothetical protein
MKKLLIAIVMAMSAGLVWALPTVQEVQAQVQAGHYDQAQTMMSEVVAAKPGSAKAHYLYAEILAHNKQFGQAAEQARLARTADPAIGFTEPEKFRAFERLLEQEQHPSSAKAEAGAGLSSSTAAALPAVVSPVPVREDTGWHVPGWAWVAGGLALAVLAWRAIAGSFASPMRSMQTAPAMPMGGSPGYGGGPGYGPGSAPGYGPGYQPGYGGAPGNTALRTGMAVAGGVAAGMLLDEALHRGGHEAGGAAGAAGAASSGVASGMQPGFFDADASGQAATELEDRPIDFGNGGDWDGGSSDSGSSGDGGW